MSSTAQGPIILSLGDWAAQRLQLIFQATTKQTFVEAFDNAFSKKLDVTYNGKKLSRSDLQSTLRKEQEQEASATVKVQGTVAVPKNPDQPTDVSPPLPFALPPRTEIWK